MRANPQESPWSMASKDIDHAGKPKLPFLEDWTTVRGLSEMMTITDVTELAAYNILPSEYKRVKEIFDSNRDDRKIYLTLYPAK